ncbi:MAG: transporter substrate-binding domain-containing protein [Rhodoblastus sp.]|nr:MAG: transporter substrate-binding domain-containing protein [Rhodoblastus sp.]
MSEDDVRALAAARALLAPAGRLRAAINCGNPVLATRADDGALTGVSVDLARAFAARLAVRLDLLAYDGAGKVVEEAGAGVWDVAFLAVDPKRGETLVYTRPYVRLEAVFVTRAQAALRAPDDLDRDGVAIAVGRGGAYALHLERAFARARLVAFETSDAAPAGFLAEGLDAAAGLRQPIEAFMRATPGLRVIEPAFMSIAQAVALPRARAAAIDWLQDALDSLSDAGFVRAALARAGQDEALAAD